jgi:hypothetical protein
MLRTAARSSGMLRTAAVRACALPAARLAPTALPFARAMALGREEGEDLVVKKVRTRKTSLSWGAGGRLGPLVASAPGAGCARSSCATSPSTVVRLSARVQRVELAPRGHRRRGRGACVWMGNMRLFAADGAPRAELLKARGGTAAACRSLRG